METSTQAACVQKKVISFPETGWRPIKGELSVPKGPYALLCNHTITPFTVVENVSWPSVEHYFQAQKFEGGVNGNEMVEKIRKSSGSSTILAHKMGRSRQSPIRSDWEQVKDQVMKVALEAKIAQNENVRKLLLSTEGELMYHTHNDKYWGDGGVGKGENKVGKMLMEIRERYKNNKSS